MNLKQHNDALAKAVSRYTARQQGLCSHWLCLEGVPKKETGCLQWVILSSSWEDKHVSKVEEICRKDSMIQSQPEEKKMITYCRALNW